MIRIESERVVRDGTAYRKITHLSGVLHSDELPKKYCTGFYFRRRKRVQCVEFHGTPDGVPVEDFKANSVIAEDRFQASVSAMRGCGKRLREIKMEISELENTWKGVETLLI